MHISLAIVGLFFVSAQCAESDFEAVVLNSNLFGGSRSDLPADSPYWWMSKGSPFKRAVANGPPQQQFDFAANPFLRNSGSSAKLYSAPGYLPPEPQQRTVSCTGPNRVCVPQYQCSGGSIDASQVNRASSQECNVETETCCAVRTPPPPPPPTRPPTLPPVTRNSYIPPPAPTRQAPLPCYNGNSVCVPAYQCNGGVASPNSGYQSKSPAASCYAPEVCCRVPEEPKPKPTVNVITYQPSPSTSRPYVTPAVQTPRPIIPKKPFAGDQYIPPRENEIPQSNTPVGAYLPPETGEDQLSEPIASNDSPSFTKPQTGEDQLAPQIPPSACPAATKCTEITFCAADGTISTSPVSLTKSQEEFRVPLSPCRAEGVQDGRCCRDPNYTDPWPTNLLRTGAFDAAALRAGGFDDGSYRPESTNNGRRPAVSRGEALKSPVIIPNQFTPAQSQQNKQYTLAPFNPNAIPTNNKQFVPQFNQQPNQPTPQQQFNPNRQPQFVPQPQQTFVPQQPQPTFVSQPPTQQTFAPQPQQQFVQPKPQQQFQVQPQRPQAQFQTQPQQPQPQFQQPQQPQPQFQPSPQSQVTQQQFQQPSTPSQFQPSAQPQSPQQFPTQVTIPQPRPQSFQPQSFQPSSPAQNPFQSRQRQPQAGVCATRDTEGYPRGRTPNEAAFGEFPWQAMILKESTKSILCGGAIIEKNVVATAAHCVDGLRTHDVLIKAGEWKLGSTEEPKPFQLIRVKQITMHPAYQPTNLESDVALLHLENNLNFDKHIGPICVDESELEPAGTAEEECVTSGWGKEIIKYHIADSLPHSLPINPLTQGECQASFGSYNPNSAVCGRARGNPCDVDAGSALACTRGQGKYLLKGIYSAESGCGENQVMSFTKMDMQFIKGKTVSGSAEKSLPIQPNQQPQAPSRSAAVRYTPQPEYTPQSQYTAQPKYSSQPQYTPQTQYTPQPQYTPQAQSQYTAQPQFTQQLPQQQQQQQQLGGRTSYSYPTPAPQANTLQPTYAHPSTQAAGYLPPF